MKKILSLAIFCIAFSAISFGQQQFKIVHQGDTNAFNNDTVSVYGNATQEMSITFNVVNTGIDSVSVYLRRDSISTVPKFDSNNTFCWVLCFSLGDTNNVSAYSQTLNKWNTPGDTSSASFIGYYKALGHLGASYIRYTFFAARNHNDSSWVMVKYIATPAGTQSLSGNTINFSAYPNPASHAVNFTYNLVSGSTAANLKIYNLLGECVQTLPLNTAKNKTTVDVQSIPAGVYVCEIEANGYQSSYKKLVVTH